MRLQAREVVIGEVGGVSSESLAKAAVKLKMCDRGGGGGKSDGEEVDEEEKDVRKTNREKRKMRPRED